MIFRTGYEYNIQPNNMNDILLNHSLILEDFLDNLSLLLNRKVSWKTSTFLMYEEKEIDGKIYPPYYQTNYYFGLDSFDKDNSVFIGIHNPQYVDSSSIHIGDTGFHYNGDYLFWFSFYNFIRKILTLGGRNVRLKGFFAEDEFVCIYANNETDIAEYFDTQLVPRLIKDEKTGEEYMGIWGIKNIRWSKKGSDLIPYLRVPYEEAKKMKDFPQEWLM